MATGERSLRAWTWALAAALLAVLAALLADHARRTSVTIDEPVHLYAGVRYWQCGDFAVNPEHPPLAKWLAAAPLQGRGWIEPADARCGDALGDKRVHGLNANDMIAANGVTPMLLPARLAMTALTVLLAIVLAVAAWRAFGAAGGLAALALVAAEPTLLAHGSLVTTDMALTVTGVCTVLALRAWMRVPDLRRLIVLAASAGALLASKHSAVLFLPALLLLWAARPVTVPEAPAMPIHRQLASLGLALAMALAVLWTAYGWRASALPPGAQPHAMTAARYLAENGRPEQATSLPARVLTSIEPTGLLPEAYLLGLADIVASGRRTVSVLGTSHESGVWFYFPLALATKASLPLLALAVLGAVVLSRTREGRAHLAWFGVPGVLYLVQSTGSGMNIGVRHVLPVFAFLVLLGAGGAAWIGRRVPYGRWGVALGLALNLAGTVAGAPHHIAFGNALAGGRDGMRRIFTDSNVEWGQNHRLIAPEAAHRRAPCWVALFGGGQVNGHYHRCRVIPGSGAWFRFDAPPQPMPAVIEGTLFASTTVLPPRGGPEYSPLLQHTPQAVLGGSLYVFEGRFELPGASALTHATRSAWYLREEQPAAALVESTRALALWPDDPRVQLVHARALGASGRRAEARAWFDATIASARRDPAHYIDLAIRARRERDALASP